MGYWKINGLLTSTCLFSVIGDRAVMSPGGTTIHINGPCRTEIYKAAAQRRCPTHLKSIRYRSPVRRRVRCIKSDTPVLTASPVDAVARRVRFHRWGLEFKPCRFRLIMRALQDGTISVF
jgi:hypothetical protein